MALKPSIGEVLAALQAAGVLAAERAGPAREALQAWWSRHGATPWYVRGLSAAGAWVAASFLAIAFGLLLSATGLLDNEVSLIILGVFATGAALAVRRLTQNEFLVQLSLAIGLAGQALFAGGFGALLESPAAAAGALLVMELGLLVVHPDRAQCFFSTAAAVGAALFLLHEAGGWTAVEAGWVLLAAGAHQVLFEEAKLEQRAADGLPVPDSAGLVYSVLGVLVLRFFLSLDQAPGDDASLPAVMTIGIALVSAWSAQRILTGHGLRLSSAIALTTFATIAAVAALTLSTPGILTAAGLLAVAFHRRSVVLLGVAVAFLIGFGALYYYDLSLSLLAKSGALVGSGGALLLVRMVALRLGRSPAAPAAEVSR